MKGIKYVLLDWGGTIGKTGCRRHFVKTGKGLLPNSFRALKQLRRKYDLGILSNTDVSDKHMAAGLKRSKLTGVFSVQVYSSDKGMCSKPCQPIFQRAWAAIKKRHPGIQKGQVMYVGNNYFHDVVPAWRFGFKTTLVSNGDDDIIYRLARLAGVQDKAVENICDLF